MSAGGRRCEVHAGGQASSLASIPEATFTACGLTGDRGGGPTSILCEQLFGGSVNDS